MIVKESQQMSDAITDYHYDLAPNSSVRDA